MPRAGFIPEKLKPWIEARQRYHLSHAQVQMARELGMNPKRSVASRTTGKSPGSCRFLNSLRSVFKSGSAASSPWTFAPLRKRKPRSEQGRMQAKRSALGPSGTRRMSTPKPAFEWQLDQLRCLKRAVELSAAIEVGDLWHAIQCCCGYHASACTVTGQWVTGWRKSVASIDRTQPELTQCSCHVCLQTARDYD